MGGEAVAGAFADIRAALAVLNAEVDGCGAEPFSAADPLAGLADGSLDILAAAKESEAGLAGLKTRAAMKYAGTAHALAPPGMPVQAQEMAVAAEPRGHADNLYIPRSPGEESLHRFLYGGS